MQFDFSLRKKHLRITMDFRFIDAITLKNENESQFY